MLRLNQCQFTGNAGKDAELRYLANGSPQAQFSLAVNNGYRKDNEWVDQTEWVNVVVWGDLAERTAPLITKGKQVYISGKMQTRSWDDDKGTKHYRTEIVANTVQLIEKRDAETSQKSAPKKTQPEELPWE